MTLVCRCVWPGSGMAGLSVVVVVVVEVCDDCLILRSVTGAICERCCCCCCCCCRGV